MKVAYKDTRELIDNIIDNALEEEREIEFIELSHGEWFAFGRSLGSERVKLLCLFKGDPIRYRQIEIRQRKA